MKNKRLRNNSISTMSLLGLIFITLKLCNVITWSWWLVTLPFWFGIGVVVFIMFIIILFVVILSLFD